MGVNYILFLGILLALALFSSRIMKLAKLPAVTGYLIIGIIVAIVCLVIDYVSTKFYISALLDFNDLISKIALGFIALSIGEEFKFSKIAKFGKKIVTITFLQALAAAILVDVVLVVVCLLLGVSTSVALCLGAVATATAPAATIMVINQYKAKGPLVDLLLPVVAFDDAIGLMIFALSTSFAKLIAVGGGVNFYSIAVVPLINIVGSLGIGFIIGLLMRLVIPYFNSRKNHEVVFISFTLIGVGLCDLLSYGQIEFSNLLVCMMIGATYINVTKKEDEEKMYRDFEQMERWTPFLFMLFFLLSGCNLVISAKTMFSNTTPEFILKVVIIFICYIVFRSLGKYYGAKLGCKLGKQDKKVTNNLGICLLPQAGVAIGMANQIAGMNEFNTNGSNIGNIIITVVLCATLVYELIGPLLTKKSLERVGEIPDSEGKYPYIEELKKQQTIYFNAHPKTSTVITENTTKKRVKK